MKSVLVGEDICVIISGGDKPHIGCVTLSVPTISLSGKEAYSSTTSVLNLVGHKDDELARYASSLISSRLNKTVVVTCGVHVDNITAQEIDIVIGIVHELIDNQYQF